MRKGTDTPPMPGTYDPLPVHLLAELVNIGYAKGKVEHWSVEKARLTLRRHQIQANATVRRAADKADEIEGTKIEGGPIGFLRQDAAQYIAQALSANDMGDLLFAVQGGVGELSNAELRRLGDHMARKLLEVPA